MPSAWDRLSARGLPSLQDELVRQQVQHAVAPFSPYWKKRFAELGRPAAAISSVAALESLPAAGERDVSPTGDPAGMAALVLQASERGFALHAPGPTLRRAIRLRLGRRDRYRRLVERDTKPTSYVWSGLGFRYPIASTRGDLDTVARAGARLWRLLGLSADDALLSAVPVGPTTEHLALEYAALAAGASALFAGDPAAAATTARLAPATVLAVRTDDAIRVLRGLVEAAAPLDRLHTVLLVGAPSDAERAAATESVRSATGRGVVVLAVHAPAGARVLWGECRESGGTTGLHTYPDLDVVQLVDAESGEPATGSGELVLTQLGLRGSALLRWRTGDLAAAGVDPAPCPACRRRTPRVAGLARGALVLAGSDGRSVDLRSMAGALSGRADIADWRLVVARRSRDGRGQVVVHVATEGDAAAVLVGVAADVRTVAGVLPSQFVVATPAELAALAGARLSPRLLRQG